VEAEVGTILTLEIWGITGERQGTNRSRGLESSGHKDLTLGILSQYCLTKLSNLPAEIPMSLWALAEPFLFHSHWGTQIYLQTSCLML
jgi:hypothetical protein